VRVQGPHTDDLTEQPTQQVSQWARLRRAAELDLSNPADSRFGDYQLLEKIGTGGMGVVYRAEQLSLEREVALKLLSFDPFSAEALISQFRTEARHAGRLQHPNIVPVYEIGGFENLYYFSMALVRGPTLRQWQKQNPNASPLQVAMLMRTIAEAVQYAHQIGILHLDLKPGNVLIDERGEPQVSDFGLARRVGEASTGVEAIIAGTPSFMAPEQADGRPVGLQPATDVWGLGGILYALLTGRPPLDDKRPAAARWRVEPMRQLAPHAPADLEAICHRCLQPNPADRYPSARALADDLQRFIDGRPVSVRRQGPVERLRGWMRREPRAAALATALLLALLLGLAGTTALWLRSEQSRDLAQDTLWSARRASALAAAERDDPVAGMPALVANIGEAERAGETDEADVDRRRLRLLLDAVPRQIDGWQLAGEGRSLALLADGGLLAGMRDGVLLALDTASGSERWRVTPAFPPTPWGPSFVGRILPDDSATHAVLLPSGSSGVARPDTAHMHRVDLASGRIELPPPEFADRVATSYSFDGKRALLRAHDDRWQLWATDPWQPLEQPFTAPGLRNCLVPPKGTLLACAPSGFSEVRLVDGSDGSLLEALRFPSKAELASWNVHANGRWLALGSAAGELVIYDLEARVARTHADASDDAIGDLSFAGDVLTLSSNDGSVRVFDLAERRWLSRPIRSGAERMGAALFDPASATLVANDGRLVRWRLQAEGDQLVPLGASVLRHRGALVGFHAFAVDATNELLASHGSEGDLKLLRMPAPAAALSIPTLVDQTPSVQPAHRAEVRGRELILPASRDWPAETINLPAKPWLLQGTRDARFWVMAAGQKLLVVERGVTGKGSVLREIALPASAQYLQLADGRSIAWVAWIDAETPLRLGWRGLDLASAQWIGPPATSDGLLGGYRLSPDGHQVALWRGQTLSLRRLEDGSESTSIKIEGDTLQISDVAFRQVDALTRGGTEVIIATSGRSLILPATLEHWRLAGDGASTRIERIETPTGQIRVFDLGDGWLTHGARPAIYRRGARQELVELGPDWGEAAAVSADGRWAAFGESGAFRLFDLARAEPLTPRIELGLHESDVLVGLGFDPQGEQVFARSHFGQDIAITLAADSRPLSALQAEADDLSPDRDRPSRVAERVERQARDHRPMKGAVRHPQEAGSPSPAVARARAQIDLRPHANVAERAWFQGSRRGLGITDSASWPRGLLHLRGQDFELGPAIQLVPPGVALGPASFRAHSGPIPLPDSRLRGLTLLIANQHVPTTGGLRLEWLDAAGAVVAEAALDVPATYDGSLFLAERDGRPAADVALIVRSGESRMRGGGSAQQLIYAMRVGLPASAVPIKAIALRAVQATPLILAITADPEASE